MKKQKQETPERAALRIAKAMLSAEPPGAGVHDEAEQRIGERIAGLVGIPLADAKAYVRTAAIERHRS